MRKLMFVLCVALLSTQSIFAQPGKKQENGKKEFTRPSAEEMTKKRAERLAKDFGLDEKKTADFVSIYTEYNKELSELGPKKPERKAGDEKKADKKDEKKADKKVAKADKKETKKDAKADEKKGPRKHHEMSEEDAKARLDAQMERADKQIEKQQKKQKIQKNYRAKFEKILTEAQVLRVFEENRQGNQRGLQQGFGQQRGFGNHGFGQQGRGFGNQQGRPGQRQGFGQQRGNNRGVFGQQRGFGRQGFGQQHGGFGQRQGFAQQRGFGNRGGFGQQGRSGQHQGFGQHMGFGPGHHDMKGADSLQVRHHFMGNDSVRAHRPFGNDSIRAHRFFGNDSTFARRHMMRGDSTHVRRQGPGLQRPSTSKSI